MSRAAPLLLCLAVSACANRPAPPDPSPYDESAYQPYALAGTATVTGSSFLITRSGDVKKGAARQVFLIPDTPFVRARMREDDKRYSTFEWLGFGRTDPAVIVTAGSTHGLPLATSMGNLPSPRCRPARTSSRRN
jgi:hypothetical protein